MLFQGRSIAFQHTSSVGMKRYLVKNVQGKARNTSSINPETRGAEIGYIYTLDLGQQKWEEYFSK